MICIYNSVPHFRLDLQKLLFVIYANFESVLLKVKELEKDETTLYTQYFVSFVCLILWCKVSALYYLVPGFFR